MLSFREGCQQLPEYCKIKEQTAHFAKRNTKFCGGGAEADSERTDSVLPPDSSREAVNRFVQKKFGFCRKEIPEKREWVIIPTLLFNRIFIRVLKQ